MDGAIRIRAEGARTYLDGVRAMSWATGEMCEFVMALTRMLDCVGSDVAYHYPMGVTGVAFRFTMGAELWNPGFYGFGSVSPDPQELVRRAFAAVGYRYHPYPGGDHEDDMRRIADSIDRGVAVMASGHLVDASDWVLITGYEEPGDALLGSSPYGGGDGLGGYDAITGWHENLKSYIILGAGCKAAAPEAVYIEALSLAVELMQPHHVVNPYAGLSAYEVLAAALRHEQFPEQAERQEDQPWFRYLCLLCYNMMLDDHRSAPPFLRDAAGVLPECGAGLTRAAECYDRSCGLRDRLESIIRSDFSPEAQKRVLDRDVREQYARTILQIRDSDAEAIGHIEQALSAAGLSPGAPR